MAFKDDVTKGVTDVLGRAMQDSSDSAADRVTVSAAEAGEFPTAARSSPTSPTHP